jgi:SAM-dependent methyltransferase
MSLEVSLNIKKFALSRVKPLYWRLLRIKSLVTKFVERFYLFLRNPRIDDYMRMQKRYYLRNARNSTVEPGNLVDDKVVGSWQKHDDWEDYELFLMRYVPKNSKLIALDFGCGPGRNIRKWSSWFARIDGADISKTNIANAKVFLENQLAPGKEPLFFETSGVDCGKAASNYYDFVFSTICLQHICSHTIRFQILSDIYRILKPGGRISIQMGFGSPSPMTVGYFEDNYGAPSTNRKCDTEVSDPSQPSGDFKKIGFENFEHWIRPVGPGDLHPNWIYITATKPNF